MDLEKMLTRLRKRRGEWVTLCDSEEPHLDSDWWKWRGRVVELDYVIEAIEEGEFDVEDANRDRPGDTIVMRP